MDDRDEMEIMIASPCTDNCKLDENGICIGCCLSSDEINAWNRSNSKERLQFLKNAYLRQKEKSPS